MTHRNRALLDLAHEAPCFINLAQSCRGKDESHVMPCHSDMLIDGRGEGHKSHDCLAVPGCAPCHAVFTRAHLGRSGYEETHRRALAQYVVWMWVNEKVRVA